MSQEKETTLKTVTPDEYEKAKNKFNDEEYSQEEFMALGQTLLRFI